MENLQKTIFQRTVSNGEGEFNPFTNFCFEMKFFNIILNHISVKVYNNKYRIWIYVKFSSRSSSTDVRASLRAARSASLISFVTKSVEEFRNGVLRSWRHCAPNSRGDVASGNSEQATAIATEIVKRRGLTSFLANDQQPSTVNE